MVFRQQSRTRASRRGRKGRNERRGRNGSSPNNRLQIAKFLAAEKWIPITAGWSLLFRDIDWQSGDQCACWIQPGRPADGHVNHRPESRGSDGPATCLCLRASTRRRCLVTSKSSDKGVRREALGKEDLKNFGAEDLPASKSMFPPET
jgi:hypothetical protein